MNFMDREVNRPNFAHKFNEMYKVMENNFNELTDTDLIDAQIYELKSLQCRHKALLRDLKDVKAKHEEVESLIDKFKRLFK